MELIKTGYIYAIKNTVNNKFYIGQTQLRNPAIRWKDHIDTAFYCRDNRTYNYHLYKSMRKYGIDKFTFLVLETDIPIELLDDKEKEYIIKYDSYNNGYNNTIGGLGSFITYKLNEEQVKEIIKRIQKLEAFTSIAQDYNINVSTISDINTGDTWHFDNLTYPIINKEVRRNFSEKEIQEIYQFLRLGLGTREISSYYGVSKTTISNINNGKIYVHANETYPIYKAVNSVKHLEITQIKEIINLLLTTDLSYTKIGELLNIGRKTISNIDLGKGYLVLVNQLGYTEFPLRKNY